MFRLSNKLSKPPKLSFAKLENGQVDVISQPPGFIAVVAIQRPQSLLCDDRVREGTLKLL